MNILNNLTIKNLKLNKKRTIVTIIGILLSTSLICAVAGMVSSFQETLKMEAIANNGNQHITIHDVKKSDLKYFDNNDNIKSKYYIENLGYANLNGSKNSQKPYVYVKAYTKEAFENTTVKLVSGRLPQDSHELVISESIIENGEVDLKIGDTINLGIGDRKCSDGSILNQNNPLYSEYDENPDECHEFLEVKQNREYKIVGIIERFNYTVEPYSAPGYSVITYTDDVRENIDVSLLFKKDNYYKTFTKNLKESNELSKYSYTLNKDLLRFSGVGLGDQTMMMLLTVAGVVIGIIVITSVFVIKNSFDISIVEKTKQYGMLSSIGATSKQIKKNVLYEGFILGVIGIPIGIFCGIFADFVLVQIINWMGEFIFDDIKFAFSVPIIPVILSIILSAVTIFLSTLKTARKTSKIPPIIAIRNNNEVKINNKKLKCPKIISKLFGIGGEIAYKNLKRSKKKYRTTVISIVVSVMVFISLSTFINYGFKMTGQYYTDYNYNLELIIWNDNDVNKSYNAYKDIVKYQSIQDYSIHRSIVLNFNPQDYFTDEAFYAYYGNTKENLKNESFKDGVIVISLGEEEYLRFMKNQGLNPADYINKGVLIDKSIIYDNVEQKYKHINVYDEKTTSITGNVNDEESLITIEYTRVKNDKNPMGLERTYNIGGYIIVSDEYMDTLKDKIKISPELYIQSKDTTALEKEIRTYINNHSDLKKYNLYNIDKEAQAQKSVIILASIFLYGFIIVISLIGVTNIFNTLTTNMNLRSKEFAMLKSIGMTKKEFNKMIRLESLMYGTKALMIGIPLGIGGGYLIYKAFASGNDMNFQLPISAIIISAVAVYLLVSLIMYFSLKKTKKQNIIETIRNDNI